MENFAELLAGLSGILEGQTRMRVTDNMPSSPMAVVYAGEKSAEAREEVDTVLHRVWKSWADDLCCFLMRDGRFFLPEGGGGAAPLSEDGMRKLVNKMFAKEDTFRNMKNGVMLCLVQDTAQYQTLEEFQKDFAALDLLGKQLDVGDFRTLKLVLLDEIDAGRNLAPAIKRDLERRIQQEEPSCRAVAVLSNRLKSGALLAEERARENYSLAGDLILIANSGGPGCSPAYDLMFPPHPRRFLTASRSGKKKPVKLIAQILVDTVLEWLGERFGEGRSLDMNEISQRLEISGGTVKSIEEWFKAHIQENLPKGTALEYLPRGSENLGTIRNLPFREYDRLTLGAFRPFYEKVVGKECKSEQVERDFYKLFLSIAREKLPPREAAQSLNSAKVDNVLAQVRPEEPKDTAPAYQYMLAKAKADYYACCLKACRQALLATAESAKKHMDRVNKLIEEFQGGSRLNADHTLKEHYRRLTMDALNGGEGERLLNSLNRAGLSRAGMLEEIYRTVEAIVTGEPIFSLPLEQEMTQRMGGDGGQFRSIVEEMTGKLDDATRLRPNRGPTSFFETILLNRKGQDGKDTEFFQNLSTLFPKARYLDTGDSNSVEFVRLYICDTIL